MKKDNQDELITDPRFSFINFDPRFKKQKKQQSKIQLDNRFKSLLKDKKFQSTTKFDKFGRKQKQQQANQGNNKNKELSGLYYAENNQESSEEDNNKFEWNEESSEESDNNENEEQQLSPEEGSENEGMWQGLDEVEAEKMNIQSTARLALQNYDWTQVNAKDIMMLMNSFKRQEGVIIRVAIYPSEYGLKQLAIEEKYGPQGIWNKQSENKEKKQKKKNKVDDINEWIVKEGSKKEADGIDGAKLREYEKQRMKYYYAVVEFDSVVTAELVYEQLDGVEFEETQMKIDLRFIPDDLQFPHPAKEICTELPQNYKMNNFLNRALSHTFVKMTWDEPQLNRLQFNQKAGINNEYDENIVQQYLASDIERISGENSEIDKQSSNSDDSEGLVIEFDNDDDDNKQDKQTSNSNWKTDFNKQNRVKTTKDDMEMEITFNQGFEELGNKILDKQKQKAESAHETYIRHKKERKEVNKLKKKMKNTDSYFVGDKKNQQSQKESKEKQLAELKLLVDKDEGEEFEPNVDDKRFQAIYNTNKYSIDPTKKKNIQESKFFKEQVKRRKQIKKY